MSLDVSIDNKLGRDSLRKLDLIFIVPTTLSSLYYSIMLRIAYPDARFLVIPSSDFKSEQNFELILDLEITDRSAVVFVTPSYCFRDGDHFDLNNLIYADGEIVNWYNKSLTSLYEAVQFIKNNRGVIYGVIDHPDTQALWNILIEQLELDPSNWIVCPGYSRIDAQIGQSDFEALTTRMQVTRGRNKSILGIVSTLLRDAIPLSEREHVRKLVKDAALCEGGFQPKSAAPFLEVLQNFCTPDLTILEAIILNIAEGADPISELHKRSLKRRLELIQISWNKMIASAVSIAEGIYFVPEFELPFMEDLDCERLHEDLKNLKLDFKMAVIELKRSSECSLYYCTYDEIVLFDLFALGAINHEIEKLLGKRYNNDFVTLYAQALVIYGTNEEAKLIAPLVLSKIEDLKKY